MYQVRQHHTWRMRGVRVTKLFKNLMKSSSLDLLQFHLIHKQQSWTNSNRHLDNTCRVTRDDTSPLLSDTDLPLNPQQIHTAFVFLQHMVSCTRFGAAKSRVCVCVCVRRTSAQCLWKYHLFCSAAGHETARKTQKPGISALSLTFTKGQKHRQWSPSEARSKKRFPIELSQPGTVPRKTPFYFSCLISAVSLCGQLMDGCECRDVEPTNEEGGRTQKSWCTCVSRNGMNFRIKNPGVSLAYVLHSV